MCEQLVILARRIILGVCEQNVASLAAVDFRGAGGVEPLAGIVSAEFQRGYGPGVLRGRLSSGAMAWWLPLGTVAATDLALNVFYYHTAGRWAVICAELTGQLRLRGAHLARTADGKARVLPELLAGGVLGAVVFYLITNTLAWLFNPVHDPEYTSRAGSRR